MKRLRAFTLIELLVVIAIIALLVSILMPSLQKAKELAKDVVCRSNQKSIFYAIMLYAQDSDDFYPYTSAPPYGYYIPPLGWAEKIGRIEDGYWLLPYPYRFSDSPQGDQRRPRRGREICLEGYIDFKYNDFREGHFKCLAAIDHVQPKWHGRWGNHLSINSALSPVYEYEHDPSGFTPPAPCKKVSDVRAGCVLIGECHLSKVPANEVFPVNWFRTDGDGDLYTNPGDQGQLPERFGPWTHQPFGHAWSGTMPIDYYGHPGDRANFLYTDGHVESVGEIDITEWNIR